MSLSKHRQAIDRLDLQIVKLLNERTRHALAIGDIKIAAGEEIYAPHRERAVFERICALNAGPLTDEQLRAIYREVMSSALALEKNMTIAYLGPEASVTHRAALHKFGASLNCAAQETVAGVFAQVNEGTADYGVVPLENFADGAVTHTLDLLADCDLKIVSQILLRNQLCLMSNSPAEKIKKLYAHPESLAQCRAWLAKHLPGVKTVKTESDTHAVEMAIKEKNSACLTTSLAAEGHALNLLAKDVQETTRVSRFLVLGRQCSPPTGDDRTSLMLSTLDRAGALQETIAVINRGKMNMTKIESRPDRRKVGERLFFIDCAGHCQDANFGKALQHLRKHGNFVKVLGSYPNVEFLV